MPVQDLVRYRDSGELSDLTVKIGGMAELRLHRFPLFIKSDYFKEVLATSQGGGAAHVELPADFPGAAECFELIADFCYNKRIDISPDNVVQLRCAAEALKMHGQGNLIDLSDRYLTDLLSAARMSRSAAPLMDLLARCTAVGAPADTARVSDRCLAALLDVWMRTTAFAALPHHYALYQPLPASADGVTEQLITLPLARFLQLIRAVCTSAGSERRGSSDGEPPPPQSAAVLSAAVNDRLRRRPLAELTARYLDRVFSRDQPATPPTTQPSPTSTAAPAPPTPPERETSASAVVPDVETKDEELEHEGDTQEKQLEKEPEIQEEPDGFEPRESAAEVLDRVVLGLPDDTPLAEVIGADWIRRALRASESASAECRVKLLQLAGNILHRFSHDELREMPPPVLCEIVSSTVQNEGVVPEVLSCVVDNHLLDLARAGSLPVSDFIKLAASMPADYRTSHDTLFEVAETLLTNPPLSELEREQVQAALDLSRCGEAVLQRALDKDLVPPKLICQAAIHIAKRLRDQIAEQEKRDTHRGGLRPGSVTGGTSRRYDTANIRYHDPAMHHQQHHFQLDSYSPTAGAAVSTTYSMPYSSSRHDEDQSLAIFEENLRAELGKISANYDHYLADKGARSEYRFSHRGSAGKRW